MQRNIKDLKQVSLLPTRPIGTVVKHEGGIADAHKTDENNGKTSAWCCNFQQTHKDDIRHLTNIAIANKTDGEIKTETGTAIGYCQRNQ